MKITAVIPSYNRAHTLERALDSVAGQISAVDEVILVDDGSDDTSTELVGSLFPQVSIIRQANRGVSAARNRGIAAAQHDWIALLDSDDCWHPEKIERIRAARSEHPEYVLYHSDEIWIRNGRRVNPMRKHRKQGGWIFRHCLPLCAISPSAAVIHKPVLEAVGGFDESLPACEDYDLWLRLCHRYPVCFIDQALVIRHAGHEGQLSQRYPAMDRFRIRALDRLLREQELTPEDYAAAHGMLLEKLDILVEGAHKHANQTILDEFEPLREAWRELPQPQTPC